MQFDAEAGHREAAQSRYTALAHLLARDDLEDDLEPEPEMTALRNEIMRTTFTVG